jgi:hypothetical protein
MGQPRMTAPPHHRDVEPVTGRHDGARLQQQDAIPTGSLRDITIIALAD